MCLLIVGWRRTKRPRLPTHPLAIRHSSLTDPTGECPPRRSRRLRRLSPRDIRLPVEIRSCGTLYPEIFQNIFGAARPLMTPATTVLAGYRSEPAKRPTGDCNWPVDSNHSDTICRNSSKAFISSRRPVRALPASVFISASAIGSIPCRSSRLVVEVRRRGSVVTCVTEAGANC